MTHKGYGTLRISSRTISTILRPPWPIACGTTHTDAFIAQYWAHCAPSLDVSIWCVHTSHWLKSRLCVFISIDGLRHAHLFLSVLFHPSLYFFHKSFFHLFLNPSMVPDENSMEDPLCNSSFGRMVSLDYVTPDTKSLPIIVQRWSRLLSNVFLSSRSILSSSLSSLLLFSNVLCVLLPFSLLWFGCGCRVVVVSLLCVVVAL